MLADSSTRERTAIAAVLLPLLGCLTWTMLWYLLHGASVVQALLSPWAAPIALLRWPSGAPIDPKLSWSGIAAFATTCGLAAAMFAPRTPALHGDARFATRAEIRKMGLLADSGVLLGRLGGLLPAYLRHNGPLHVLLTAPTRSGKGVGVVLPNLLSWPGSVVVLDVKNECFEATGGFRERCGQKVYRFAPGDPERRTHRYNPLDAVRRDGAHRIADLQAIAHLLAPESTGEQKMWNQEARSLFIGICLYILDTPDLPLTFGQVVRILEIDAELADALAEVLSARRDELDPACVNILSNFIHKAMKERSGVKSTLTGALALWHDPAIDAATAQSDFSFEALRREPTTIYVSVSLDQLERLAFLLNLLFQQLVGVTARRKPNDDEPCPVLILIDEFASLGRMDLIVDTMPFLAGFNARLMLVVQGLAQLDRLYGTSGRELILQNAGIQIFYATNDDLTSGYVSKRLGTRTVVQLTRSRSVPVMGGSAGTITRGKTFHARPLLTTDEVRRLGKLDEVVFIESGRPLRAHKIVHHADDEFASRVRPAPEIKPIEVTIYPPFRFESTATAADPEPSAPPEEPVPDLSPPERAEVLAVDTTPAPKTAPARRPIAFDQLDFNRLLVGRSHPGQAGTRS